MNRLFLVAALLLTGCYSPSYRDCDVTCGTNVCPSGLSCVAGYCRVDPNPAQTCESILGDAGTDGSGSADAPPASMWSTPTLLIPLAQGDHDVTCRDDLSEIYYVHQMDLYHVVRGTSMQYGNPMLDAISQAAIVENGPDISSDGQYMVWGDTSGGVNHLRFATRDMATNAWGNPTTDPQLSSSTDALHPTLSRDRSLIVFERSGQPATAPLWSSTFGGGAWTTPQVMSEVATWGINRPYSPMLSTDKLTLYFHTSPSGDPFASALFESHRASVTAAFGPPTMIDSLHTAMSNETDPWISSDGNSIVFIRTTNGISQVMLARRTQ